MSLTAGLTLAPAADAAFPLTHPGRADSLDALGFSAYWSSGGHPSTTVNGNTVRYGEDDYYPIDFNIVRWTGSQWVEYRPTGSTTSPENKIIYGMPVYSPVDGQIISCWKEQPNGNCSGATCLNGGNHINILTSDGEHVVYMGHLDTGSVDPCPFTDDFIDDNDKVCAGDPDFWEGYPLSSRLDTLPGPPIFVQKGELIGHVGYSGTTSPHLHMHVKEFMWDMNGDPCQRRFVYDEIDFSETWFAERSSSANVVDGDWTPALQDPAPLEPDGTPRQLFWPDPIGPRMDEFPWGDGDLLHNVTDAWGGVMAYRNGDGDLQLESYGIAAGNISPEDTKIEGPVQDVGLAHPFAGNRDVVAAVKTSLGNLFLIPYDVDSGGTMMRVTGKEYLAGAIKKIEAVKSPTHNGVTVVIQGSNDKIKVIDFVVNPTTMAITRPGTDDDADTVSDIAIDAMTLGFDPGESSTGPKFAGVVTAERAAADSELILRTWTVSSGANVAHADTEWTGVTVSEIDVTTLKMGAREVVLASARDGSGDLWVQYYYVSANGTLTPADDIAAGEIGALSIAAVGERDAVTVMSDSGDDFRMIAWGFNDDIHRSGGRKAGEASEVLLKAAEIPADGSYLISLVRSLSGELKMLVHGSNFDPAL